MPSEFLELAAAQIRTYRGFPYPAFLYDRTSVQRWRNEPASLEYGHLAGEDSPLLSEFDAARIFTGLEEHGSLVLRDAIPMSDRLLTLLPIHALVADTPVDEGVNRDMDNANAPRISALTLIGFVALLLPDTIPRARELPVLTGSTPNALVSSVRSVAERIFTAMDAAFAKASMIDAALWVEPHLNEISIQVYRMLRGAKNIEKFADMQKGTLSLMQEPLDICRYLSEVRVIISGLCASAGIPVEFVLPDDGVFLYVDRECFEHALYNVLFNAILYTREGNRVAVCAYQSGGRVCVSIADKGTGIPPELFEYVFVPYVSFPLAGCEPGAGLGLTMAKWLTTMQNGSLALTSEQGAGTTVTFSFPDHSFSRVLPLSRRDEPYRLTDRMSELYVGLVGLLDKPYKISESGESE
jgi:signal transduction histidine kinase